MFYVHRDERVTSAMTRAPKDSHPTTNQSRALKGAKPIAEILVKAKQQPRIPLGTYTVANPPKGFEVHLSPDPEPETIVTQITSLKRGDENRLVLHIANYGSKPVTAEVWQL